MAPAVRAFSGSNAAAVAGHPAMIPKGGLRHTSVQPSDGYAPRLKVGQAPHMIQVGREVAYQPVLIEVGAGALHVHLFLGRKLSANPIEGGGAGFDVPGESQLKHSDEMIAL